LNIPGSAFGSVVQQEGKRRIQQEVGFYSLDSIISAGYRVKSAVATRFRICPTLRGRLYELNLWTENYRQMISRKL
jgi:hypothetical protein